MLWQVQEAKQRFSELLRVAHAEGPQFVTRHGREVAVVIDIADYRHLKGEVADFRDYLLAGPRFDELESARGTEYPRTIDRLDARDPQHRRPQQVRRRAAQSVRAGQRALALSLLA